MRKYKVLHLTNFLDLSGQQEDTLNTCIFLNQERFETSLAANMAGGYGFDNILAREAKEVPHVKIIDVANLRRFPRPWHDLLALRDLYRLMKREQYDIVHMHATKVGFLGRLAARLAGVPISILAVHGWSFQYTGTTEAVRRFFLVLEKAMAPLTDKYTTLTQTLADDALKAGVGKPEQYAVTFSGINLDAYRNVQVDIQKKRADLGLPATGPIIGTVTIMNRHKGVDDIIRAVPLILNAVPDAHFLLVGDGEAMPVVRQLVKELNLEDKVTLTGLRRDVPELLPLMSTFVHMAWFEILPRAILQALAAGVPVVVADAGSVREIMTDGYNGYVVPTHDYQALADRVVQLLTQPGLRQQMSEAAITSVNRDFTFTLDNMIRTTEQVYDDLIATKIKE